MPALHPSTQLETAAAVRRANARARALAAVALLTAAALALRILVRADRPMWFDEGFSIALARGSFGDLWTVATSTDANGSLHSLALWVWMRVTAVLPVDELERARLLSAVAGAATVPALYAAGRTLFGRGPALAAAALLTVNQLHAYYSNEARGYALLTLLVTVASWLLVRALDFPSPARWTAYSAVAALSVYAHVLGGFSVAAQLLAALVYPPPRSGPRARRAGVVLSGAVVFVLVAPLAFYAITHPAYASWIAPLGPTAVPRFFGSVSGDTRLAAISLRALLPLLEGACVVLALVAAARVRRRDPLSREAWGTLFAASWVFVPVVLAALVSLAKPIFLDRYLLAVVPGWLLLVSAGVFTRWSGRAAAGATGVLLILSLSGTLRPRPRDPPRAFPWDEATAYVLDRATGRDALVFSHAVGVIPFDHHARGRHAGDPPGLVWPPPGDPNTLRSPALPSMIEPLAAHRRVWFVLFGEQDDSKATRAALEARGLTRVEDVDFEGIRVLRYER